MTGTLRAAFHPVGVALERPFRSAAGTQEEVELVRLAIELDGTVGLGEAAPQASGSGSVASACAFLEAAAGRLGDDPFALMAIDRRLDPIPGDAAGRAALDAALLDLCGKLVGLPVWRLLGLARSGPPTMYSLGIAPPAETADRARRAARRFRLLKLKVGAGDGLDVARVEAVRGECDTPVAVDANGAWSLDEALESLPRLATLGVTLVEQPLAAGDPGGALLKRRSPVPIFLDEECRTAPDVAAAAGRAHGVNVKLMKAGGIRASVRAIHTARALGLAVMIGCGVESALGIAAASQIASLADHADLDGNLLLATGEWSGLELRDGVQTPSLEPGLGIREALPDPR